MSDSGGSIRDLTSYDMPWVVEATRLRRELLVPHAPRFWRPAVDATKVHRDFLAHLVADPDVLAVRTDTGYLIAAERAGRWVVDDAVVTRAGTWALDGFRLLRHAQEHAGALRLVVPLFETDRMAAGRRVGLTPVEVWWHRDLGSVGDESQNGDVDADVTVMVEGASGRLVPAPPVYDPGGPVLLVTEVEDLEALRRIEEEAVSRRARVAVVTQDPDDPARAALLTEAGFLPTTAFLEAR